MQDALMLRLIIGLPSLLQINELFELRQLIHTEQEEVPPCGLAK